MAYQTRDRAPLLDSRTQATVERRGKEVLGLGLMAAGALAAVMLATYSPDDPSWLLASDEPARNWLGSFGASVAHPLVMIVGRAAWAVPLVLGAWGLRLASHRGEERGRTVLAPILVALLAAAWASLAPAAGWDRGYGLGGLLGDTAMGMLLTLLPMGGAVLPLALWAGALALGLYVLGFTRSELAILRRRAVRALVLAYQAALAGAGRAGQGLAWAAREGQAQAAGALERRRARLAADRELLEAEERALRAVPAPRARSLPASGPSLDDAFDPRDVPPGTRRAARVPVLRPGAPGALEVSSGAPRGHVMPPPLPPSPEEDEFAEFEEAAPLGTGGAPGTGDPWTPLAKALATPPGRPTGLPRQGAGDEAEAPEEGGEDEAPRAPALEGGDRIRARIGEAIRSRMGGGGRAEAEGRGVPAALAAALMAVQGVARGGRAVPAPRTEPPLAAPSTAASPGTPIAPARVEPPLGRVQGSSQSSLAQPAALPTAVPAVRDAVPEDGPDAAEWDEDEVAPAVPAAPALRAAPRPGPTPTADRPPARRPAPRPASIPAPVLSAYEPPPLDLLADPARVERHHLPDERLEENARNLESVLDDYGVKGEIVSVRPGPVVTMYELEPAPGLKASRVIGLSDDIARSMSALSARVSTVPGRSVIGIELPNDRRERVVLREILSAREFGDAQVRLPLALGKDIGGTPVIANLAKMPHLLIAGTTGSGKSVAINTMILSLLYKLTPEECRLIMIDPKMLELSVYDGIPHLLSPVVTDPKKAVVALKWVVGEMEERYRKMSKMNVRGIDAYNGKVRDALARGETFKRVVQTGFDDETGDPVFEADEFTPEVLPFIVVVVDEMADLMMVAGKEIEACIQRLAQMARASGIHLIMATQRPSVDVITGTIKANFPTRISFQVTSKIDSRTILGEQGAEQLLGQGDMLYMAGGGRITRIHGPFCSDEEVEEIVNFLKGFGPPSYVGAVLEERPDEGEASEAAPTGGAEGDEALYDMAVQIVARDRKCSTSYIQRKLAIGYNKAARLVEQMEEQGVVTRSNHVGKREILVPEPH